MTLSRKYPSLPENRSNEFNLLVQSLINNLIEEIKIYSELYQLFINEREIIRNPSIESLKDNNMKIEACLLKAQNFKDRKEDITEAIKRIFQPEFQGKITLSNLAEYADVNLKEQLSRYHEKLNSLINALTNLNVKNQHLLRSTISHTGSTLMFIRKSTSSSINYLSSGQVNMGLPNGKILNKRG
ncbi:FlgN protein [Syntrophus gentianae]|uniref:FlgN protein n=1 Tax=Syntrophus gentianae TaxID=43775 RepID=A0A1H7XRV8_9BACT|nr:flagellar protein FlgN [Syntrophus gentianae]SEM35719.1 FlgN protein [Syntrophus gentianae]